MRCTFGGPPPEAPAGPLVHWWPTTDQKRPPVQAAVRLVLEGELVEVESPFALAKGASLFLYAGGGGELAYSELEALLERVHLALWETFETDANFEIGEGTWLDRDGASSGGVGYLLPVRVLIPVLSVSPTAKVERVAVST